MNNTTKTTQELREAIEQAVSDIHFCSNTEDACSKESHTKLILSLIAKHEAELVEKVRTDVIGRNEECLLPQTEANVMNYKRVAIKNNLRAEQRAKLTALTEKESGK